MSKDLISRDGTIHYTARDVAKLFLRYHLTPHTGSPCFILQEKVYGCAIGALGRDREIITDTAIDTAIDTNAVHVISNTKLIEELSIIFPSGFIEGITRGFDYFGEAYLQPKQGWSQVYRDGMTFGQVVGKLVFWYRDELIAEVQAEQEVAEVVPMTHAEAAIVEGVLVS